MDYVQCHPSKAFFVRKHPVRTTVEEEVNILKSRKFIQPLSALTLWDQHLRHGNATNEDEENTNGYRKWNRVRLIDLGLFVLDSHCVYFLSRWASIYDILLQWGLWRDQVVYSYAMIDFQEKVDYLDFIEYDSNSTTTRSAATSNLGLHSSKKTQLQIKPQWTGHRKYGNRLLLRLISILCISAKANTYSWYIKDPWMFAPYARWPAMLFMLDSQARNGWPQVCTAKW